MKSTRSTKRSGKGPFDIQRGKSLFVEYKVVLFELLIAAATLTGRPVWLGLLLSVGVSPTGTACVVTGLAVGFALVAAGTAWCKRKRILQERCDRALGKLANYLRTETQDYRRIRQRVATKVNFEAFCNEICDNVAGIFQAKTAKSDVGCCLRLSDTEGREEYLTKGRSSFFDRGRRSSSRPVTTESGVCKRLSSQTVSDAVLFIDCMEDALARGEISMDDNIERYPDEIGSMMVARLNVFQDRKSKGGVEALWGILYVTSPRERFFAKEHEQLMKVASNMVAKSLWDIVMVKEGQKGTVGEANGKARSSALKGRKTRKRRGPAAAGPANEREGC